MHISMQQKCSQQGSKRSTTLRNWGLLYAGTFIIILPLFYGECNRSIYFALRRHLMDPRPYTTRVSNLDKTRLQMAREYFRSVDPDQVRTSVKRLAGDGSSVDIVIAMVTASREKEVGQPYTPDYVTQTVAKLLSQMTDPAIMSDFPYTLKMIVCNGGTNPALNEPAVRLGKYFRVLTMPSKPLPKTVEDKYENENLDYMLCLNESLKYSPRYVLALEDDAYPREDMWDLLKYTVASKLDTNILQGVTVTDNSQVAYVKLMRPEYLLCYFKHGVHDKLEVVGISMVLGTLLTLLHEAVRRTLFKTRGPVKGHLTWAAWCAYIAIVVLVIGRPCILEFRRFLAPHLYSYVPAENCCIPAVIFPRHGVHSLVEYLNKTWVKPHDGKDVLMDHWLAEKQMKAYQVFPSAFLHIGHISTKLNRDVFRVY